MREKTAACSGFIPPERKALSFDPESGKIYKFFPDRVEVIRLRDPYPAAWQKTARTGFWQNRLPKSSFPWLFSPPQPLLLEAQSEALQRYLAFTAALHGEIAAWVGGEQVALLDSFSSRSWFLHCLFAHGGERALELARTNPSLAWLLSAHAVYHPLAGRRYWRSIRSLLDKKRRGILDYFGFPASEAAVRLFSRIRPASCGTSLFFILRSQLRESPDLLRQLSFHPLHNSTSLRIICSRLRPRFSFHALAEIAALDPHHGELDASLKLRDVFGMSKALAANGAPQPWFEIRSLASLDTLHDELVEKLNQLDPEENLAYGEPPLPDIRRSALWIEGIRCSTELLREGRSLRHCIYSYHGMVSRGECFVARMLVPERLTILYRESYDRFSGAAGLELVDARGSCNALPAPDSLRLISLWLQRQEIHFQDPDQLTIFDGWDLGEFPAESGSLEF